MNVYSILFWVNLCTSLREQWRRSDNLAQASGARLSESIRKPSQELRELSLRRRAPVLSERPSHSGKEVSPKWENATTPLFLFLSSRLGERNSPKRETHLTWARPFSLSENWVRVYPGSIFLSVLVCLPYIWVN